MGRFEVNIWDTSSFINKKLSFYSLGKVLSILVTISPCIDIYGKEFKTS